jgi:radical SAM superfamily enzyme YgiQ (UPF0313 family)
MPRALFIRLAPWLRFKNRHPHDLMWPCSLLYSAGIARRCGWEARVLDTHVEPLNPEQLAQEVLQDGPEIVFIDSMTPTIQWSLELARLLRDRAPSLRIIAIGQHASARPQDVLDDNSPFEAVIRGEHEASMEALFSGTAISELPGGTTWDGTLQLHGGHAEVKDLGALPPIDPQGLHLDRYRMQSATVPRFGRVRWGFLLTSRGCPFPCTFCSQTLRQSYGRGYRGQPAEQVVDDVLRLHRDVGMNAWYTIDDVFSLDRDRVAATCEGLIRAGAPTRWIIQTRGELVDPELCKLMKRAGCVGVKMGVESGVPRVLKQIRKQSTPDQMRAGAHAVKSAGLQLTAYYMLGHPTETLDEMEQTFRFARELDADMIQVAFHTPYPGSDSWDEQMGHVEDLGELNHYETQHVNLSEVDNATLEQVQRSFYLRYYLHPRTFSRYVRRRLIYRAADLGEWRLAAGTLKYLLLRRGVA